MISAFICREHGLMRELEEHTLNFINTTRLGAKYADKDAAIDVLGSAQKKPLESSPFVVFFDYGENKEGYWNYNHMVVQFKDVLDCLKIMYLGWDFVFLFDHSSGHAKQRPDGLNAAKMNKSFGGKSPEMRQTLIAKEEGFLGPFEQAVAVGQEQHLVFQPGDKGPFWMIPQEREENRNDVELEETEVQKVKAELVLELQAVGVSTKGNDKKELLELCVTHGIPPFKTVAKIHEGWEGKAKGLSQVLWE